MEKSTTDNLQTSSDRPRRTTAGINRNLNDEFVWPEKFGNQETSSSSSHSVNSKRLETTKSSKAATSQHSYMSIERKRLALETEMKKQELEKKQRQLEQKEIESSMKLLELERQLKEAELLAQEEIESQTERRERVLTKLSSTTEDHKITVSEWVNHLPDEYTYEEPKLVQKDTTSEIKLLCETISNAIKSVTTPTTENHKFIARNSVERDFPYYDGNPQEWPLFYKQFKNICALCDFSNEEIMLKLQKCLKGEAKSTVAGMLLTADNVDLVMETLKMRFGRPEFVIDGIITKVRNIPYLRDSNFEKLIQFSSEINNMVAIIKTLNSSSHLQNPQLLRDLIKKLPDHLKLKWGEKMIISEGNLNLEDFSKWVGDIARAACYISTPSIADPDKFGQKYFSKKPDKVFFANKNIPSSADTEKFGQKSSSKKPDEVFFANKDLSETKCCYCEKKAHSDICPAMQNDDIDKRWATVTAKKLCFSCLKRNHHKFKCRARKLCGIDGCQLSHHQLLHKEIQQNSQCSREQDRSSESICTLRSNVKKVQLRVLTVFLHGPKGPLQILALCDGASTVTLLDERVAKTLGLKGPVESLCLQWTNDETSWQNDSMKIDLKISKADGCDKVFTMKGTRTVNNLSLPPQNVRMTEMSKYVHLKNLPVRDIYDEKPVLLIGQDNIDLIIARQIRCGPENAPLASKCKLGWAIHGASHENSHGQETYEAHRTMHICELKPDIDLHEIVRNSFSTENFGVLMTQDKLSRENARALNIMEETIKRCGDRYEIGLLWRTDNIIIPESKIRARQRLNCVERKCRRLPAFGVEYCQKIQSYQEKGYIRKLSKTEAEVESPRTCYLPHFAVENPNKNKIRLEFDAASKSNGASLNDNLLSGPDLLQSLVAILWKFRQRRFGFCGDVKEMFHQVGIREEDRDSQRFLWRNLKYDQDPDVYEMMVMTFGATCSPVCAQFVKNYHAEKTVTDPYIKEAIIKKFYVDDYLDSRDSEEEAIQTVDNICSTMKNAGFEVVNWMTNSAMLRKSLSEDSVSVKQIDENSSLHRVLGLWWDTNRDEFRFKLNMKDLEPKKAPTKRIVLQTVMSLFDPLGLISSLTIKAKILLQDIWRSGMDWDDTLNENLLITWSKWINELPKITEIRIPRCYSPQIPTATNIELHTFCDSSEKAFAAVSFLRVVGESGKIEVSLVSSKTRVAPLKPLSIPRLELQAAVMASRLAQSIKSELDIPIMRMFFWSDSKCVISWIKSDGRKFKQFVSHRIGEIQERTKVEDWRWISTDLNPADEGTRQNFDSSKIISDIWIFGPKFLRLSEEYWPREIILDTPDSENLMEMKTEYIHVCSELPEKKIPLPDIRRFSKWLRLVRCTAWCQRFLQKVMKCLNSREFQQELNVEEIEAAEKLWIRQCQLESFPDEMRCLENERPIGKHNRLSNLHPKLKDKIIVLDGRTDLAKVLDEDTREPIILDPKHDYTKLIIRHFHEKFRHRGIELILNEIRQKYWVINGRAAVKSAFSRCQKCRNERAEPLPPLMGQLPKERFRQEVRPFVNVGMDYFGPIHVKIGRRNEKRWGVIFTCLSVRAIHLEVAHSLNSESAIMAILRMIARRGQPKVIFCDNGTNFIAAAKDIKKAFQDLDHSVVVDAMSSRGIDFKFNPPGAPHMGGTWERLIGLVKKIISKDLYSQSLREETLQTFFTEAEHIVNSRPLTRVSSDPADLEAITPNHFLLGSSNGDSSCIRLGPDSICLRREWKKSQMLLENFWKRWVKEYLPTLSKRNKWTNNQIPIQINDVVILVENNVPRYAWKLGRVTAIYPGPDGKVRVVDVKTALAEYRRPVTKICRLELEEK